MTDTTHAPAPPHSGAATIGIVDDDHAVRAALASLVRSAGLHSRTFDSGPALLGSGSLLRLSCLILDQRMQGMSGLDVLHALRQAGHRLPVVIVSAHDDRGTRHRAAAAGAFAFVSKPFHDLSVVDAVRAALACARPVPGPQP